MREVKPKPRSCKYLRWLFGRLYKAALLHCFLRMYSDRVVCPYCDRAGHLEDGGDYYLRCTRCGWGLNWN